MISGTIVLKNQFIDSQISHGWWLMKIGFEAPVDQPMVTIYGRVCLTGPSISPKGHDGNNKAGSRNINDCAWKVDVEIVLQFKWQFLWHSHISGLVQKNLANHWLFFSWLLVQLVLMTVATAFFLGSLAQNFALPITTFLGLLGVWLATFFLDRCLSSGSWAPGADQVTGGPRFSCSLHHLMVIPYQNQWFIIIFSMKTDVFEGIPYFQTNQFQVVGWSSFFLDQW